MTKNEALFLDDDVYVLTAVGEKELRGSETSLSPSELELMVHMDGKLTVSDLRKRVRSLPADIFTETFKKILFQGLIARGATNSALDFLDFFSASAAQPSAAAISEASAEAPDGARTLERQGYYVRIARRAAQARKLAEGQKLTVVVIEDEAYLVKFLGQFLALEGFLTRTAGNRSEIVAQLSRPPRPDLVLLDVMLPDADGFDVLMKMRQHPALKSVPIVMLTAKASREAVLKGLSGGADGYITKPFEIEVLIKAVKTVLGLFEDTNPASSPERKR